MAKIISPVWSSIRGSICGTTYFTLPSGQIIARQRTKPVQPGSTHQTIAKNALILAVSKWDQADLATQLGWNAWASANGPGSGRQQFIGGQAFQAYGDLSAPTGWPALTADTTVPDIHGHPSFTAVPIPIPGPGATGVAVSIKNTSGHTCAFLIERSVGLSPARSYWKGPWDVNVSQGASIIAGAVLVVSFPGLVLANHYAIRVRSINTLLTAGHKGRVVSSPLIVMCTAITVV